MKTCRPECLVIASSCVAGVIGDDVDEEARQAEETYGIPVLSMAFPAFWVVNIPMAIINHGCHYAPVFKKQDHKKGKVLLLGDQMGPEGQYAREVKRLLSFFGLTVDFQFPGYVPFQMEPGDGGIPVCSSRHGGAAGGNEGKSSLAGKGIWHSLLGDCYPLGLEGTWSWIRRLADFMKEKEKGRPLSGRKWKGWRSGCLPFCR